MAKFRIVILPAKMLIGGKHKLRIAISHNSDTRWKSHTNLTHPVKVF